MMAALTPNDVKMISGFTAGDRAVISLTGKIEGEMQFGPVELTRKDGIWRITKENWSDTPPKK